MTHSYDAVVVGAGPNGLAAAIALARAGHSTMVLEASSTPGGGCRSDELTHPGFVHDVCSAIHPMAAASPFFRELPLPELGARFIQPDLPAAHPLDGGRSAFLDRDVLATAEGMGRDRARYAKFMSPWVAREEGLVRDLLQPIRIPRHLGTAAFGLRFGFGSVERMTRRFESEEARALLAGMAAHSMLPLNAAPTAALALMFTMVGHVHGWPLVEGGSQKLTDSLVGVLRSLGGEVRTGIAVRNAVDIPPARVVLFDVTPRQLAAMVGDELPARYVRSLSRFRYGPGVWKVDWALRGPVPWTAAAPRRAGTVHVGGTFSELARSEAEVAAGRIPERPFVLVAQQSLFDEQRAPDGHHTLWGYCHVPHGSKVDMTDRIEAQIERFAPGFKDLVIERRAMGPAEMERYNPNYIGGDINGGMQNLRQFLARPVIRWDPYSTPNERFFMCSSSTPPGGGVHGMCGYNAAQVAMRKMAKN